VDLDSSQSAGISVRQLAPGAANWTALPGLHVSGASITLMDFQVAGGVLYLAQASQVNIRCGGLRGWR